MGMDQRRNIVRPQSRRLLAGLWLIGSAVGLAGTSFTPVWAQSASTSPASTPRPGEANPPVVDKLLKVFKSSRTPETQKDTVTVLLLMPESHDDLAEALAAKTETPATKLAILQALAEQSGNPPPIFVEALFATFESGESRLTEPSGLLLARIGDKRVVDKLFAVGNDPARPTTMRLAAVSALGQISNQESLHYTIDRLMLLLDSPSVETSNQAMASVDQITKISLGKSKQDWKDWWSVNKNKPKEVWLKDLNEVLVQRNRALQAANDTLRERLRSALEQIFAGTPEAGRETLLSGWLKDPLPLVQTAALAKLDSFISNRQPDRITPVLRDQLRGMLKTSDPAVRAQTVSLLGTLRESQSAETMVALLAKETDPTVKVELLFAISNLRVPQADELLVKALHEDSEVVVAGASRAIRQLIANKAVNGDNLPILGQALIARWKETKPDQPELRESLLSTLSVLLSNDARTWSPLLADIFKSSVADASSEVKLAAVTGLGNLADLTSSDKVQKLLADALADKDARIRSAAADGLGRLSRSSEHFGLLVQRSVPETESDAGVRDRAWSAAIKMLAGGTLDPFLPVIRREFTPPFAERSVRAERMADLADQWLKPAGVGRLNPETLRQLADLAADAYIATGQYAQARQMLDLLPEGYPSKHGRSLRVMVRVGENLAEAVNYALKEADQPYRPSREELVQTLYEEAQRLAKTGETDELAVLIDLVTAKFKPSEDWQRRFLQLTKPTATQASE